MPALVGELITETAEEFAEIYVRSHTWPPLTAQRIPGLLAGRYSLGTMS